jgi:5-methylcytosine-specific restriction endonuclease McrA
MNKINKNDQFVRRAIWEIYNHRCCYTHRPLEYMDMEINHIIPESYKNKNSELKRIIKSKQCVLTYTLQGWLSHVEMCQAEARRRWDILETKIKNSFPIFER